MVHFIGEVKRVLFHSDDNNFTIAAVKIVEDKCGQQIFNKETVIKGEFQLPQEGESLEVQGEWVDSKYGKQIDISSCFTVTPVTAKGLYNFLRSGKISGVRDKTAMKIIDEFGDDTVNVLDNDPDKLTQIHGITPALVGKIKESWNKHRKVGKILMQLQGYDIPPGLAYKIYERYGVKSLEVITQEPYRTMYDIDGVGFVKADSIAMKLGLSPTSVERIKAALFYILQQKVKEGHTCYPYDTLFDEVKHILKNVIPDELVHQAFKELTNEDKIISQLKSTGWFTYLTYYCKREGYIAMYLSDIMKEKSVFEGDEQLSERIDTIAKEFDITLTPKQKEAIENAVTGKVTIITGGPGTGKTTIVNIILKYLMQHTPYSISMAAPTGRAAKRMKEISGHDAQTIHRLLEYFPPDNSFGKDEHNQLRCEYLIIDETSMVDVSLMYYLMRAVNPHTSVILIGDKDQLPSVGPGTVLKDFIMSKKLPTIVLDTIFRQAENSLISINAHLINAGKMPHLIEYSSGKKSPFYFIEEDDPPDIVRRIKLFVKEIIPQDLGFDPMCEIQVLSPMNIDKVLGTINLNKELQDVLNTNSQSISRGAYIFKLGDKVMQTVNNYDKNVFNGDIGFIEEMDVRKKELGVMFDDRVVSYESSELGQLQLAYAVSVHKFQGSEHPVIVMPIVKRHYRLLQRNLIYTAVTRGKKLVVLIGQKEWLSIGISNNNIDQRFTFLKDRIIDTLTEAKSVCYTDESHG